MCTHEVYYIYLYSCYFLYVLAVYLILKSTGSILSFLFCVLVFWDRVLVCFRLALNSWWPSCLRPLSARMTGVHCICLVFLLKTTTVGVCLMEDVTADVGGMLGTIVLTLWIREQVCVGKLRNLSSPFFLSHLTSVLGLTRGFRMLGKCLPTELRSQPSVSHFIIYDTLRLRTNYFHFLVYFVFTVYVYLLDSWFIPISFLHWSWEVFFSSIISFISGNCSISFIL